MKIGIMGSRIWGERHYAKLRSFGFDCYDFQMPDTEAVPYTLGEKGFFAYLAEEKRRADEAGLTIWQAHGPWRYPPRDGTAEERAERAEKMQLSIRGAAVLGARYWVVHPMMPYGVKDLPEGHEKAERDCTLELLAKLLPAAKREGVTICLENMPFRRGYSLSSPAAIADLVREVNDPALAMCLDTGHANVRADWQSPAEAIRAYPQEIKALHVHDNGGEHDEHLLPYCGTIDWADFSAALGEVAFDGVFSLECVPSKQLPIEILEVTFPFYFNIAKAIADRIGSHTK